MKYKTLLLICLLSLFCVGCRDYNFGGGSAEEVIINVEKNKDLLDKLNAEEIRNKGIIQVYDAIDTRLIYYWASPEIMTKWYKIWLESINKSKEKFCTEEYINEVSCQALIWFIRTGDRKTIEALPELFEFPYFEEAKDKYLHSSPLEFAEWAKTTITDKKFRHYPVPKFYYYSLLESAALVADDYALAKTANRLLYSEFAPEFGTISASNVAFYVEKSGELTEADRTILLNYYDKYLKGEPLSRVLLKKRQECILNVLKKNHIVEDIDVLPSTYRETSEYEFMKLYNKPKTPNDYWEYKGKKGKYHFIEHYSRVDKKSNPSVSETVIIKIINMPDNFPSMPQKDAGKMDGQK